MVLGSPLYNLLLISKGKKGARCTAVSSPQKTNTSQLVGFLLKPGNYTACDDATVKVFNYKKQKLTYTLSQVSTEKQVPFTCLRWRPVNQSNKIRNIILTVNAEGLIQHWHLTTGLTAPGSWVTI